jgi:hypothetical protein
MEIESKVNRIDNASRGFSIGMTGLASVGIASWNAITVASVSELNNA